MCDARISSIPGAEQHFDLAIQVGFPQTVRAQLQFAVALGYGFTTIYLEYTVFHKRCTLSISFLIWLEKVIVYPRSDCCQYRFLDLEIYLDKEKTIQCHPIFDWSNDEKYIKKRTKTGLVYDCFSDRITETIIATNKDHTLNIVEVEAECTNLPENFYLHHSNDYPGAVTLASRISGNNIIDRVSLKTNWELSFGIYLLGKQSGWRNIIHISTKYDHDRQPAVWFHNNSYKLHIVHSKGCSSYNHNDRIVVNVDYGWKTGQFHKFKFIAVQHETDAKASRVSLYIDDVLKESWIRSDTCVGREANVFVSKSTNSANVALVDYNYK